MTKGMKMGRPRSVGSDGGQTTALPAHVSTADYTSVTSEKGSAVPLLSACMVSPAARVVEVLRVCRPDLVHLVDPASAVALEVVAETAGAGMDPGAELVNGRLLQAGHYAGWRGDLVRSRVLSAVSPAQPSALLGEYAAAVLGTVFRARLVAAGEAFAAGAAGLSEGDLFALLDREAAVLGDSRARLVEARGFEGVAW